MDAKLMKTVLEIDALRMMDSKPSVHSLTEDNSFFMDMLQEIMTNVSQVDGDAKQAIQESIDQFSSKNGLDSETKNYLYDFLLTNANTYIPDSYVQTLVNNENVLSDLTVKKG